MGGAPEGRLRCLRVHHPPPTHTGPHLVVVHVCGWAQLQLLGLNTEEGERGGGGSQRETRSVKQIRGVVRPQWGTEKDSKDCEPPPPPHRRSASQLLLALFSPRPLIPDQCLPSSQPPQPPQPHPAHSQTLVHLTQPPSPALSHPASPTTQAQHMLRDSHSLPLLALGLLCRLDQLVVVLAPVHDAHLC